LFKTPSSSWNFPFPSPLQKKTQTYISMVHYCCHHLQLYNLPSHK
jgi:hypothetical protein